MVTAKEKLWSSDAIISIRKSNMAPEVASRSLVASSTSAMRVINPISTFNQDQIKVLSYLYLTTSFMSLFGSASIVLAVIVKKKISNKEVHPIFHLSLADFLGSLFLIAGAVSYHILQHGAIKAKSCPYLTGFATAFYMNTFLLTINYARAVYQKVAKRVTGESIRRSGGLPMTHFRRMGVQYCSAQLVWYGLAWFLPLMVTLFLFAIDHTSYGPNDNICSSCLPLFHFKNSNCQKILDPTYKDEPDWYGIYKYIFVGFLSFSLIGSLAFNMMAYRAFRSVQIFGGVISLRQREMLKSVRRRLGLFCATFLFCWTPSLILGIISMGSSFQMKTLYWLYIVQACTCPLQGFLNSLIYGWYRPSFKQAINERSPLIIRPTSSVESDV